MAVVVLRWAPRGRVSGDVPERFGPALRAGARYVRHSRGGPPAAAAVGAVRAAGHGAVGAAPAGRQPAAGARLRRLRPAARRARRRRGRRGGRCCPGSLRRCPTGRHGVRRQRRLRRRAGRRRPGRATCRSPSSCCCRPARPGSRCCPPSARPPRSSCPAGCGPVGCRCSRSSSWAGRRWARSSGGSRRSTPGSSPVFVAAAVLMAPRRGHDRDLAAARHRAASTAAPRVYWPEPQLIAEPDPDEGPVLITVTFTVPPENVAARSSRR